MLKPFRSVADSKVQNSFRSLPFFNEMRLNSYGDQCARRTYPRTYESSNCCVQFLSLLRPHAGNP